MQTNFNKILKERTVKMKNDPDNALKIKNQKQILKISINNTSMK